MLLINMDIPQKLIKAKFFWLSMEYKTDSKLEASWEWFKANWSGFVKQTKQNCC